MDDGEGGGWGGVIITSVWTCQPTVDFGLFFCHQFSNPPPPTDSPFSDRHIGPDCSIDTNLKLIDVDVHTKCPQVCDLFFVLTIYTTIMY